MQKRRSHKAFTLIEVMVAVAIFVIFAIGVYGGTSLVFKIVYQSRMRILETALLAEELEIARNLPFESVGIEGGAPSGVLPHTKVVTRNGINYNIVVTVRNIDDPFDGTIGGIPNDLAPADFKLVEMSAICQSCTQQEPVIVSTIVSPKGLEGSSNNGALFIQVFDANGLAVQGANIHVTNTARTPYVVIEDTTDNEGMLKIVDTPTGTLSYQINVDKDGYSADYTVSSTADNPNPIKPPANVASQTVTEISFSIDRTASFNLSTMSQACAALGSVPFTVWGNKLIGSGPDVNKYRYSLSTNGSGEYSFANMEWDTYNLSTTGTSYDIAGSIPMIPFYLAPGSSQNVSLILRPHSSNSFLVKVKDAGTLLPLADAAVHLSKTGYDETMTTGLGYARQTDWSGGSGQTVYTDETKYFSDTGTLDVDSPAGDVKLKRTGGNYAASGVLESSTFDLGASVEFRNLIFEPTAQPPQTGANPVRFQLATSNSSSPATWNFAGPDGASSTYYISTSSLIWSGHNGQRYLRYKLILSTANTNYTPQLSEISFTYTTACIPPGQSYFYSLDSGAYNLEVSRSGYISSTGTIDVSGYTETTVSLSTSG